MVKQMLRCPGCGGRHEFSPEEVAAKAGQPFVCQCGRSLRIPTVHTHAPDHVPAEAPRAAQPTGPGPWRDGKFLVVTQVSPFPVTCMRCGAPIPHTREVQLTWPPKNNLPLGPVRQSVDAAITRQSVPVRYGRCPRHTPSVTPAGWTAILCGFAAVLALVGLVAVLMVRHPYPLATCLFGVSLAMFAGAVVASVWPPETRIVRMDDNRAWIAGFGETYLASLPELRHR